MSKDAKTYRTRNGLMTAQQAAYDMLDSAAFRLRFLEEILEAAGMEGDGVNLPEYTSHGLARILSDIAYDVSAAKLFYSGDSDDPGKLAD